MAPSVRSTAARALGLAVLALLVLGAGVAWANTWGQRMVDTGHACPGGVCKIRGARARFVVQGAWSTAPDNSIYASVDVEPSAGSLIQIGYDLEGSAVQNLDDCGTGGHVLRINVEWEIAGVYHCRWGPPLSPGSSHELSVVRCAGAGEWCAYLDGRRFGAPHRLGPDSAAYVYVGAEQYQPVVSSVFGLDVGGRRGPLQVTRDPRRRDWVAVGNTTSCVLNDRGDFSVGAITNAAFQITSLPSRARQGC